MACEGERGCAAAVAGWEKESVTEAMTMEVPVKASATKCEYEMNGTDVWHGVAMRDHAMGKRRRDLNQGDRDSISR